MPIELVNVGVTDNDGTGDSFRAAYTKINTSLGFLYETGTWTPVLRGVSSVSGQTYTKQRGDYVRIGDLVMLSFDVQLSNKGTTLGSIVITGMPFAVLDNADARWVGVVQWLNLTGTLVYANLVVNSVEPTTMLFQGATAAAASISNIDQSTHLGNTSRLIGSITYRREP